VLRGHRGAGGPCGPAGGRAQARVLNDEGDPWPTPGREQIRVRSRIGLQLRNPGQMPSLNFNSETRIARKGPFRNTG
jgi:hypothetical protein